MTIVHRPTPRASRYGRSTPSSAVSRGTNEPRPLPCLHEGPIVESCQHCTDRGNRHVRLCAHPVADIDKCTRISLGGAGVQACNQCPHYEPGAISTPPMPHVPVMPVIPDRAGAARPVRRQPVALQRHFNSSLIEFDGRLLLASRQRWLQADIYLTELNKDLHPTTPSIRIIPDHPACTHCREDPRLFVHNGQLHVSFIGLAGKGPAQLYGPLDPVTGKMSVVYHPKLDDRPEKNWAFFSHRSKLFAVYTISPHCVVRIDGDAVQKVATVDWTPTWGGLGHLRGGAPPVRVGDEYYHWFHGMAWAGPDRNIKYYPIGLYTFDAKWPFTPRRGPIPMLFPRDRERPEGWYASVNFPVGAFVRNDRWVVSMGVHDHWTEVLEWPVTAVEEALNNPVPDLPPDLKADIVKTYTLPGWCSPAKATAMADLIVRERPSTVVEIGVFGGRSLLPQALAARHVNHGVVHGIDPWTIDHGLEGTHPDHDQRWWKTVTISDARARFFNARASLGVEPWSVIHERPSYDAAEAFTDGSVDVLHIDGNHSPEVSSRDVDVWLPKVRSGGWIWFDDSNWESVANAINKLDAACHVVRDSGAWRLYQKR